MRFEKQIKKAITKCYATVSPRLVFSSRKIIPSIRKDSVPTTQNSLVVYEYSCRCDARYVGRTSQRLCDRVKQHVPSSIRNKTVPQREQPSRASKPKSSLKHDSAIGQHLLDNPECAKAYSENCFRIIGRARSTFHLAILESVYIKTRDPLLCRQKEFVFALGLLK